MDEIERKLRMFYVLESKDRWEHLLIVADECEEKGDTELAEALRQLQKSRRFASLAVYSTKMAFAIDQNMVITKPSLVEAIQWWYKTIKTGGVIFTSADQ